MTFARKEIIGNATLYLGDCREVLPALGPVDAVITDPPYGINYQTASKSRSRIEGFWKGAGVRKELAGKDARPVIGDSEAFDPAHLLALAPKLVLWGGNAYADKLPGRYGWLVWDKDAGDGWSGSDCELAWTNFGGAVKRHRQRWQGIIREGEECPFVGGALVHPTQKPVALMRWCIERAGRPDTVLDPYMGSGTTGVAAVEMGAKFIGVEIDAGYFAIACKRIEDAQRQSRMFG